VLCRRNLPVKFHRLHFACESTYMSKTSDDLKNVLFNNKI